MHSMVQNTGTANVGKKICEVTGEGERPDRCYQTVFPPTVGAQQVLIQPALECVSLT